MHKKDGPLTQMMVDTDRAATILTSMTDPSSFSEGNDQVWKKSATSPVTHGSGKGIDDIDPRDSQTLKEQSEKRMRQADFVKNKLLSFSERMLADMDMPQVRKDEVRLFVQELRNTLSEQEGKIRNLTETNEDLLNSIRGSLSSHLFVDENTVLRRYVSGSLEENEDKSSEIGKPLDKVSGPVKFCALLESVKRVIATSKVFKAEIGQDPDRWFKVLIIPNLRHSDGRIEGAIITVREITAIKQIQKMLEERNKSLLRINEDLDNFVYTTSRHLFDPLARLEGLVELLKVKVQSSDADATNVVDMIQNALVQFKINISELDEIGSIETEMLKAPDPVVFESLMEDVKGGIHDMLEAARATITSEFGEKQINFSKKSLRSIFYNLVVHAIQCKSPTRDLDLYISSYSVPGYIVLMVKDNGMGIPPEKLHLIFRRNYVSDAKNRGRGLGLYLVKRIVDASGGKIEVDNLPGEGTVFRIFLRFDCHVH